MKTVCLLRHAKALPADAGGDDFARPLAEAGRTAARQVGAATADEIPDLILCSPSRRTQETLALILGAWNQAPTVLYEATLYLAEWDDLLDRLRTLDDAVGSVWIVGHNPGLHELAIEFARYGGVHLLDNELGRHFPTASRACFTFDADSWRGVTSAPTSLSAFVTPRRAG